MKNKPRFAFPLSCYLTLLLCLFLNACSFIDMFSFTPRNRILYAQQADPNDPIFTALRECAEISPGAIPGEDWNKFNGCMLKKGYKSLNKPEGWRNACGLIPENLTCKAAREARKAKRESEATTSSIVP